MRAAQRAAIGLFEQAGFDEVTVGEVGAEAGISPSTIYRHFGTKEQLVLWDEADAALAKSLGKVLGKRPPLEALRSAFVEAYATLTPPELELQHRRGALIDSSPQLQIAMAGALDQGRLEIQEALQRVYRKGPSPLVLEMAVRIAFAALITGFEAWQTAGPTAPLPRAIDSAFAAAIKATTAC